MLHIIVLSEAYRHGSMDNKLALVADYLLLRDFEACGIMFVNGCVVITTAMVILLRDFGPYGITFMTVCFLL
jgi:hypothetical protein